MPLTLSIRKILTSSNRAKDKKLSPNVNIRYKPNPLQLKSKKHSVVKNIDDIISSWKYSGSKVLTKEKIAIDNFIDRTLVGYDNLGRLHREYNRLLNKYARLLADEPESRLAVEGVLRNVEVLQVAIGEIHVQTLDVKDSEKANEAMALLMKDLSKAFDSFQSKMSGIEFNFKSQIVEKPKQGNIVGFTDCSALEYRHTFQHTKKTFMQ